MPTQSRRRRNAQDSTLINVRAAKARIVTLEKRLAKMEQAQELPALKDLWAVKRRLDHVESILFELFAGFEAAQKVSPQKGYKR